MKTGARRRLDHLNQGGIRYALLMTVAALAFAGVTYTSLVHASDRDTPAYMIYVDPVTGKYSTKPPADSNNSGSAGISSPPPTTQATTGSNIDSQNSTAADAMTAVLTAVLLLTSAAFVSLLLKGNRGV